MPWIYVVMCGHIRPSAFIALNKYKPAVCWGRATATPLRADIRWLRNWNKEKGYGVFGDLIGIHPSYCYEPFYLLCCLDGSNAEMLSVLIYTTSVFLVNEGRTLITIINIFNWTEIEILHVYKNNLCIINILLQFELLDSSSIRGATRPLWFSEVFGEKPPWIILTTFVFLSTVFSTYFFTSIALPPTN